MRWVLFLESFLYKAYAFLLVAKLYSQELGFYERANFSNISTQCEW